MGKLKTTVEFLKADLDQIKLGDNSRKTYDQEKIIELAESIKEKGMIYPIITDRDLKIKAGYRRYFAHKYLVSEGESFNQINYIINDGDPVMINLIENLQRENLSSIDTETALLKLSDDGFSHTEISKKLNKRLTWVSDTIIAGETRKRIEDKGFDTSIISTSALSQIRGIPDEKLSEAFENIINNGGTVSAAKKEAKAIKTKTVDQSEKKDDTDPFQKLKLELKKLIKKYPPEEIINIVTEITGGNEK